MIRRWVTRRTTTAYTDRIIARLAYHAGVGTPREEEGRRYLEHTQRRYERWCVVLAWFDRRAWSLRKGGRR